MSEYNRGGPVSLYLHFPFCERKCRYCDFLSGPASAEAREEYIGLLCRESALRASEVTGPVDTVFIGGGTPSIMSPEQLWRVMDAVRSSCPVMDGAEISMEVNPGTADPEKLRGFREAGINRLSIGVQSFDDNELRLLGRIHTASQAREIFRAAREAGFSNINLDLMSALPGQNIETWTNTLREAAALGPEHLSAYSLIIEERTPFASMLDEKKLPELPSEEEDRRIYHFTKQFLASKGYRRYEISNYAREGCECRHNCGYWTGHQYLGLGLGASSDLGCERFRNPADISVYREILGAAGQPDTAPDLTGMRCERQFLTAEDRMEEFMFLGLRMTEGVSENEFRRRFGLSLEEKFGDVLQRHLDQGVIRRIPEKAGPESGSVTDTRIALTEYGLDVANYVMADYLL